MKAYIIFSEITDCLNTQTLNYLNFVSEEKRKRLEKYRFSVDCKLSLYADLLVRTQIISKLGLKNRDKVTFAATRANLRKLASDLWKYTFGSAITNLLGGKI